MVVAEAQIYAFPAPAVAVQEWHRSQVVRISTIWSFHVFVIVMAAWAMCGAESFRTLFHNRQHSFTKDQYGVQTAIEVREQFELGLFGAVYKAIVVAT